MSCKGKITMVKNITIGVCTVFLFFSQDIVQGFSLDSQPQCLKVQTIEKDKKQESV